MEKRPLRVGLFGLGLEGHLGQIAQKPGSPDIEVCNLGLIDSPGTACAAIKK